MTLDTVTVNYGPRRINAAVSWDENGIISVEVLEIEEQGRALYGLDFEAAAARLEQDADFQENAFQSLCQHYSREGRPACICGPSCIGKDDGGCCACPESQGVAIDRAEYQLADR